MTDIFTLDKSLTKLFNDSQKAMDNLDFNVICELDDEETIKKQVFSGIYRIDIHVKDLNVPVDTWMKWFKSEWEQAEYKKQHVPNTKPKRIDKHTELKEWMPLYIGKSKSIEKRVLQHIKLGLDKPTAAMKLHERENMKNEKFRLSTININVENYDLIMPTLERKLRDKYNPLLGRQ